MVYISIGSNMGDKLKNCRDSVNALVALGSFELVVCSPFYKTEPMDYREQAGFINCLAEFRTTLDPFKLVKTLKAIEGEAGRLESPIRFGPRILDLDIVLFDSLVLYSPYLIIPHPRMHKRRFVLKPICDIDPCIIHPVFKRTMQVLHDSLDSDLQKVELF